MDLTVFSNLSTQALRQRKNTIKIRKNHFSMCCNIILYSTCILSVILFSVVTEKALRRRLNNHAVTHHSVERNQDKIENYFFYIFTNFFFFNFFYDYLINYLNVFKINSTRITTLEQKRN